MQSSSFTDRFLAPLFIALTVMIVSRAVYLNACRIDSQTLYHALALLAGAVQFASVLLVGLVVYPVTYFRGATGPERVVASSTNLAVWVGIDTYNVSEAFSCLEAIYYGVNIGAILFAWNFAQMGVLELACRWGKRRRGDQGHDRNARALGSHSPVSSRRLLLVKGRRSNLLQHAPRWLSWSCSEIDGKRDGPDRLSPSFSFFQCQTIQPKSGGGHLGYRSSCPRPMKPPRRIEHILAGGVGRVTLSLPYHMGCHSSEVAARQAKSSSPMTRQRVRDCILNPRTCARAGHRKDCRPRSRSTRRQQTVRNKPETEKEVSTSSSSTSCVC